MKRLTYSTPTPVNPQGGRYTRWARPRGSFVVSSVLARTTGVAADILAAGRPSERQGGMRQRMLEEHRQRLLFVPQAAAVDVATDALTERPISDAKLRAFSFGLSRLSKNFPCDAFATAQIVVTGHTPPSGAARAPRALRDAAETWVLANIDRNVHKEPAILGSMSYMLITGEGRPAFRRTLAEKCLEHALVPEGHLESITNSVLNALFWLSKEMPDIAAKAKEMVLSPDFPTAKRELSVYKTATQG